MLKRLTILVSIALLLCDASAFSSDSDTDPSMSSRRRSAAVSSAFGWRKALPVRW